MLSPSLLPTLCCLFLLVFTAPATARDQIGIYWDNDYTQTTTIVDPLPGSATGYLVITDPSAEGGIVGWDLCVEKTGGGFIYSWDLAGQAINLESEPCFSVALSEPLLPTGNAILLATFQTLATTGEPAAFFLSPQSFPQYAEMFYVPASDTRYPVELTTATGSGPVAQLSTNAPWAVLNSEVIDFRARAVNQESVESIIVENIGRSDLVLDIQLSQDCVGFFLPGISGLVTVPTGSSVTIPITFLPLAHESYACRLDLGPSAPSVPLNGTGRNPLYQYTLTSDRYFGELFTGNSYDLDVVIDNTGFDAIPIVPSLLGCGDDFAIVSGGEPTTVNRWGSHTIVVRFQPTTTDTFTCALSFGDGIDQVGLRGIGRTPGAYFDAPEEVDFGDQEAGLHTARTVRVQNTGTSDFTLSPALIGCGGDFDISDGGHVGTLAAGDDRIILVRFQPGREGDFSCTLSLGEVVTDVHLFGHATPPHPRWSVNPPALDFSPTPEGETRELLLRVTNTGIINFDIDVQLTAADPEFALIGGEGLATLEPSVEHLVRVRFQPNSSEVFSGVLDLGPLVPSVNISGTSYIPIESCRTSESELGFGNTVISTPAVESFFVRNDGNHPLPISPVSDSPRFTVSTAPFTLQPGTNRAIEVTFAGAEQGFFDATINLGNEVCPEVYCHGSIIPPIDPGPDAVGIFFDNGYTANEAYPEVNVPFDAHLVLFNPSGSSAIAGWEAKLEIDGYFFRLSETYPAPWVNAGTSPDYVVGYETPLPPATAVKLVTFLLLTIQRSEVLTFALSPVSDPIVPGQMSWVMADDQGFVRMNTTTGEPLVATTHTMAPVGLEVPTPLLTQQGAQVHLSWPAPLQPGSTCHVYRRTATEGPERLTAQPLNAGAGTLTFTDNPEGFDTGTTLYYSYAVIVDGAEQSRSLEVEFTFESPRVLTSRLLPNVPNPFNPLTRIRFELAQSSEVQVSIFDLTGRLVKVLENGNLGAGEYSRTWQGRDESGRPVASGAYYVRLVMDNQVDHQKIMLLK